MQVKTIKKVIGNKLKEWLETISDLELRKDLEPVILVSGGSICSMFLDIEVNDFDIYIQDRNVLIRLVKYYTANIGGIELLDGAYKADYEQKILYTAGDPETANNSYSIAVRNLKEDQIKLFFETKLGGLKVNETIEEDKLNYTPLYFSPNAISLSHKLQIVLRFHGTAEQIHKTFDFIHATNYFSFKDGVVTNKEALESLLTKQLKYQGSHYPVTSIIRTKKFIKRGWNISAGELLKIMFQISQLDLSNPDVLDEQLIGVDVAYFDLLIHALRAKYENDKDFKITTEYFNALIDKIFNESD